jgi:hypothetical protein
MVLPVNQSITYGLVQGIVPSYVLDDDRLAIVEEAHTVNSPGGNMSLRERYGRHGCPCLIDIYPEIGVNGGKLRLVQK